LSDEKNLDGFVILDSRPLFELLLDDDLEVLNAVILVLVAVVAELVLAVATEEKGRNKRSGREVVVAVEEEEVVAIKLAVAMYTPLECILLLLIIPRGVPMTINSNDEQLKWALFGVSAVALFPLPTSAVLR